MAKELYLYSPIYGDVAENLISAIEENSGEDMVLRINSPGGSVFDGWGIIAKIKEAGESLKAKIDGMAGSMAAVIPLFIEDVEALDISKFVLHRADGYVGNAEDQAFLDGVNKDLRSAMKSKLDLAKLKEIKGVTLDDIFNPDTRIDVVLTAKEAKQIGLISRVKKINTAEVNAFHTRFNIAAVIPTPTNDLNKNPMKIEELKAQHPALFAEVTNAGIEQGVLKERARVKAFMNFNEIDAKAVSEAIEKGTEMDMNIMSDFTAKGLNKSILAKTTETAAPGVTTTEVEAKKKEEDQKKDDFLTASLGNIGIKAEAKKA